MSKKTKKRILLTLEQEEKTMLDKINEQQVIKNSYQEIIKVAILDYYRSEKWKK